MVRLKLLIEVLAGIVPNQPMVERTKIFQWVTGDELKRDGDTLFVPDDADPEDVAPLYQKLCDDAMKYARALQDPKYLNWVRVEWVWM